MESRSRFAEANAQRLAARPQGFTISRHGGRSGTDTAGGGVSNWGQLRQRNREEPQQGQDFAQQAPRGFVSPRSRLPQNPRQEGGFTIRRQVGRQEPEGSGAEAFSKRPTRFAARTFSEPVQRAVPQTVEPDIEHVEPPPPSERVLELQREEEERAKELEERRLRREREKYVAEPDNKINKDEFQGRQRGKKGNRRDNFITEEDDDDTAYTRQQAKAELKRQRKAAKAAKKAAAPTPIFLPEYISVANLATALRVRYDDFVYKMEDLGFEDVTPDLILNGENAGLIAQEYNFEALIDKSESEDLKPREQVEDMSIFPPRPPIVTIMGHVDHGKTTILDFLRKSSVAAGEAGGITQHIGAFSVPMPSGKTITFLDTPGHAAFLSMRQRGANVTDIVVLVVAADDSVKPQTIEAINHAKGAKVPIIVAINKCDKEEADIQRVKQDLARHNVEIEDYGGDTQVVCVSGKTGLGMDELEEAILTLSDVLDMRADTEGAAEGIVLEASVKSMGKVATVLVRYGTMHPGDVIVAGKTWARIRCMRNEAGHEVSEALPGQPVEIDGWREMPLAGDEVLQAETEQKAKSVIDYRVEAQERDKLAEDMEAINEERRFVAAKRAEEKKAEDAAAAGEEHEVPEEEAGGPKQIYFIVKGDVSGSVEAVVDSMSVVGNQEIMPYVLRSAVGPVSEFDVEHAAVAKGFIVNFSQALDPYIKRKADRLKVAILDHDIIYKLVDDVKEQLSDFLPPIITQKVTGEAEVAQVFDITIKGRKQKPVAGCKIRNGTIQRNSKVRVIRKGKTIYDGKSPRIISNVGQIRTGGIEANKQKAHSSPSRTSRKISWKLRRVVSAVWALRAGMTLRSEIRSRVMRRRRRRGICKNWAKVR